MFFDWFLDQTLFNAWIADPKLFNDPWLNSKVLHDTEYFICSWKGNSLYEFFENIVTISKFFNVSNSLKIVILSIFKAK